MIYLSIFIANLSFVSFFLKIIRLSYFSFHFSLSGLSCLSSLVGALRFAPTAPASAPPRSGVRLGGVFLDLKWEYFYGVIAGYFLCCD